MKKGKASIKNIIAPLLLATLEQTAWSGMLLPRRSGTQGGRRGESSTDTKQAKGRQREKKAWKYCTSLTALTAFRTVNCLVIMGPKLGRCRSCQVATGSPPPDPHPQLPHLWTMQPRAPAKDTSECHSSGFLSCRQPYGSDSGTSGSPGDPGAAANWTLAAEARGHQAHMHTNSQQSQDGLIAQIAMLNLQLVLCQKQFAIHQKKKCYC